jgi:PAS domain S-box-containing protein
MEERKNSLHPELQDNEDKLEAQVLARTEALRQANLQLQAEIKERKRLSDSLLESEMRFRQITENTQQVFWMSSPAKDKVLYISPAYEKIWGRSCASLYASPMAWMEAIHPEDRERVRQAALTRQVSSDYDEEYRIERPDGSIRWIRDRAFPVLNEAGQVYRIVGIADDITEHKLADQALHRSQEQYAELVNSLDGIVWSADAQTFQFTFVSRQAERLLGYPLSAWLNDPTFWPDHIHPDDREKAIHFCLAATAARQAHEFEYRMLAADGRAVWLHDVVSVICEGERVVELRGVMVDITARKQAEVERRRLTTAIEQSPESVVITDTEGAILYVNPAFEQITGYSRAEAVGQTPRILLSGQQEPAFYQELWATIKAGEVWRGRIVNRKKDGSFYTEEVIITPVRNEQGQIVNYVSLQRDITRELQLTEQYRQAQKMEAVGRLAGGVAHDFNNLLTAIMGYTGLALETLHPNDPLRMDIEGIQKTAERAANLTRQLLAFARKQVIHPVMLNLNELLMNLSKMLRRLIGEDIELVILPGADLGYIKADPGQLEQMILNLVVNARDAMPNGGKLTLATANITLDQVETHPHGEISPGNYIRLDVSDTGAGMTEEVKAHIFEPFFTTKQEGQGTGLGLATVFGIINQNNGHIWCESQAGWGATFHIYLPRLEQVESRLANLDSRHSLPRGTETILIVEDEAAVRGLMVRMLGEQGYTLLVASNGYEALTLAQEHQQGLNLLLTDMVMPGLSGKVLAERLRLDQPQLKVLFISGYTDEVIIQPGTFEQNTYFLQKPFMPSDLVRQVRQVLDEPETQD